MIDFFFMGHINALHFQVKQISEGMTSELQQ